MNIFEIQDGGQPPLKLFFFAMTQQLIARFWRNVVRGSSSSHNFGDGTHTGVPQNVCFVFL